MAFWYLDVIVWCKLVLIDSNAGTNNDNNDDYLYVPFTALKDTIKQKSIQNKDKQIKELV